MRIAEGSRGLFACSDADIAYIASLMIKALEGGACRSAGGVCTAGQKPLYA